MLCVIWETLNPKDPDLTVNLVARAPYPVILLAQLKIHFLHNAACIKPVLIMSTQLICVPFRLQFMSVPYAHFTLPKHFFLFRFFSWMEINCRAIPHLFLISMEIKKIKTGLLRLVKMMKNKTCAVQLESTS